VALGNKPPDFMNGEKYLYQLKDYQLLKDLPHGPSMS
jgi:hypothetical protein